MPETLCQEYEARVPVLTEVSVALEAETRALLAGLKHIDRISFRVKGVGSFVEKATDPMPLRFLP